MIAAKVVSLSVALALLPVTSSSTADEYQHDTLSERHFADNPAMNHTMLYGTRREYLRISDLEPTVRRKRLENMARSHDANGDDILDTDELKAWVQESLDIIHYHDAYDEMKRSDWNKDGKLNFHEVLNGRHADALHVSEKDFDAIEHKFKQGKALTPEEDSILAHVRADKKRFETADLNRDRLLDRDEYHYYIQPFNYPFMQALEMDLRIEQMDINRDGLITNPEFSHDTDDKEMRRLSEMKFRELDINKDEKLTREELKPYLIPNNEQGLADEASSLLEQADENKDGQLTIDEIVKREEAFVSGLATNFGNHLHLVKDEL